MKIILESYNSRWFTFQPFTKSYNKQFITLKNKQNTIQIIKLALIYQERKNYILVVKKSFQTDENNQKRFNIDCLWVILFSNHLRNMFFGVLSNIIWIIFSFKFKES